MTYCHYERLTALDSAFLELEDGNAHMHIGAVAVFEEGPLAREGGGIDFERILASIAGALETRDRFQHPGPHSGATGGLAHPIIGAQS